MTVNLTPSANGRKGTRNAGENWRSGGKRKRQKNSAGYGSERRRKMRRRGKRGVKKTATVTAAAVQTKASMIIH